MLFGSVPTPPKKQKSSTSTQSAMHRTIPAQTATRVTEARLLKKPIPMAARQITRNRFTAQPCAASKAAKPASQEEMKAGWGVADISCTIPVSVPGTAHRDGAGDVG